MSLPSLLSLTFSCENMLVGLLQLIHGLLWTKFAWQVSNIPDTIVSRVNGTCRGHTATIGGHFTVQQHVAPTCGYRSHFLPKSSPLAHLQRNGAHFCGDDVRSFLLRFSVTAGKFFHVSDKFFSELGKKVTCRARKWFQTFSDWVKRYSQTGT